MPWSASPTDELGNRNSVGESITCLYFSGRQYGNILGFFMVFDSASPILGICFEGKIMGLLKFSNKVVCLKVFKQISKYIINNCSKQGNGLNLYGTNINRNTMHVLKSML